jgi:hypothetical protein
MKNTESLFMLSVAESARMARANQREMLMLTFIYGLSSGLLLAGIVFFFWK